MNEPYFANDHLVLTITKAQCLELLWSRCKHHLLLTAQLGLPDVDTIIRQYLTMLARDDLVYQYEHTFTRVWTQVFRTIASYPHSDHINFMISPQGFIYPNWKKLAEDPPPGSLPLNRVAKIMW
jgi:hypothetical protein